MMNGKLYIVGIGPGDGAHLTPAARQALQQATVIAGYRTYLELVPDLLLGKQILTSGMRQEVERCRLALEHAVAGETVALVSGGDAGIYGMAGLALELAGDRSVEIEVVPGISALQAAAARLGAPLMHDFAVVSLSDLLTSWEIIALRLNAAAAADFVLVLYNPRSKQRTWQLETARDILLQHRPSSTPVGIVRHACRQGEEVRVTTLDKLPFEAVDMFSLVIIGNGTTYIDDKSRMITPRGYQTTGSGEQEAGGKRQDQDHFRRYAPRATNKAKALFVGGTGSDVGKSIIVAGLCRLLKCDGVDVAPFKAQNMALNSAVTPDGAEIGRAQALQAAACGLAPHADMNPILLKPNSETGSQVIVHGRPVGNMSVAAYHAYKPTALAAVKVSLERLLNEHQVVIMEGAGSIAEINLKQHDITNLKAADLADAPVLLVADIDRGGVFASIVGTLALLDVDERARVKGIIINRFRGEKRLLEDGLADLETRTGVPVLGVVPWLDLHLPEEDSVALARKKNPGQGNGLRIGVVRLPRISNYTDFDSLERTPGVCLSYLTRAEEIASQDVVILPGSKSVMTDLADLRQNGMAEALLDYHAAGGRVIGICGGYQMLGQTLRDPDAVESEHREMTGLGLLAVETTLAKEKQTFQVSGETLPAADLIGLAGVERVSGYEIHVGETTLLPGAKPLFRLSRRSGEAIDLVDGAVSADRRVWGTYLHGLYDDAEVREALLALWDGPSNGRSLSQADFLERELDRLADHLAAHLDLSQIRALLGLQLPGAAR